MNETPITVVGNLTADPLQLRTKLTGAPFTKFRVAKNNRRRDHNGRFVDVSTDFYDVVAFNDLGINVHRSVKKGHPVVVQGRLTMSYWTDSEGRNHVSPQIEASSIGHDLSRGSTEFAKGTVRADLDRMSDPGVRQAIHGAPADPYADVPIDITGLVEPDDEEASGLDQGGAGAVASDMGREPGGEPGGERVFLAAG